MNSDLLVYWRLQLVRQAQDTAYKLVKTNHMRAIDILGFGTWSTQSAWIDGVHEDYNYIRIHVCLFFFFVEFQAQTIHVWNIMEYTYNYIDLYLYLPTLTPEPMFLEALIFSSVRKVCGRSINFMCKCTLWFTFLTGV